MPKQLTHYMESFQSFQGRKQARRHDSSPSNPFSQTERSLMPHEDTEIFVCAYSHCRSTVEKFPFKDEHNQKYCSPFCRRKAREEKLQAIRDREEADSADTVSEPAG